MRIDVKRSDGSIVMLGTIQDFPLTLDKILDHAAKWHPTVEVVTAHDGGSHRIGYAALRSRAVKISRFLTDIGIEPGQRVATLAWNSQEHMEVWFAIMGMGAVCHTLNPRLTSDQLAAMVVQSEARILVASADLLPQALEVADSAPVVERVLVIDGQPALVATSAKLAVDALDPNIVDKVEDFAWGRFDERAACGLCFTSGSTGAPKGVTYTHRSSFLHTLRILQADLLALTSADTVLPVVPMFHANAWGLPFAVPASGGKLVLPGRRTDGESLARLIKAENVTVAVGVPTVWLGLIEYVERAGVALPSLRRIVVGGAPMPPALMERLERMLGIQVQTSWGMTELSPVGTLGVLSADTRQANVSGRPALGVDFLLVDADGTPLEDQRDAEGHLLVRGAAVIERYFGNTEKAVDEQGWFDTGDLARIDPEGNLEITGRAKDLIKSGGEWINPAEIEKIVSGLPQVALAAVVGRCDEKWGERPILVVETHAGETASDADLLMPLEGNIASWWIPDEIIRVNPMPLAATGKIDKLALREKFA